jgi:hypothetical protein
MTEPEFRPPLIINPGPGIIVIPPPDTEYFSEPLFYNIELDPRIMKAIDKQTIRGYINSGNNIIYKSSTGEINTTTTPIFNTIEADTIKAGNIEASSIAILGTPEIGTDAATVEYVNERLQGLDVKESVRLATIENLVLSGLQTIDGFDVISGDRILVKNQTYAKDNGIYIAHDGDWTRALDFDEPHEAKGAFVFVAEGDVNSAKGFVQTNNSVAVVGTHAINFTQFNGTYAFTAGDGLTKSGNTLNVDTTLNFVTEMTGLTNIGTTGGILLVGGNLEVGGDIKIDGGATITGVATIYGDTTFYNAVTGPTYKEYNDDIKNTFATLDWVDWFVKNEGGVWSVDANNNTIIHNTNLNSSVGIGTTNPTTTLDVNGGVTVRSGLDVNGGATITGVATINNGAFITGELEVNGVNVLTTIHSIENDIVTKLDSNATEFGGNAATASAAKEGSALQTALNLKLDSTATDFDGNAATASAAKEGSALQTALNLKLDSGATEFTGNAATASAASAAKEGSALQTALNGKLDSNAIEFGGNAATASATKEGSALQTALNGKLDSNAIEFGGNAATASDAKEGSALQTALNGKLSSTATEFTGNAATASAAKEGSALENALNLKAPLNNPSFSGTLTASSISASSISLTTEITSDVSLSTSQTSVISGSSLIITIDAASANQPGTVITLLTGANSYTLNDGNSKTATISANTSTIIITTGDSAGDIVAYSNGTLVSF